MPLKIRLLGTFSQIFVPFSFGYYLSYLYRSVNAVIAPDIVQEFDLSASELGLLTSMFFLAFASMQIPVGIMLDRLGPRVTNTFFLLFGGVGAVLFAVADNITDLLIARAIIGAGFSAALMSSFKVFSIWFPSNWLPTMNGCIFFCGGLGAISATTPVIKILEFTDWRGFFYMASVLTFFVAFSVFCLVPERKPQPNNENFKGQLSGVVSIFLSSIFWRMAFASTVLSALNMAVQTLWAAPWLTDVASLEINQVGYYLFILGISTMIGFLFWGMLATWLLDRGIHPNIAFKWGSTIFLLVQVALVFKVTQNLFLLWACFGFFGTVGSLAYVILAREFPKNLGGRVNTALNLLVFLTAFGIQWSFGVIVNIWPISDGSGYESEGYSIAFFLFYFLLHFNCRVSFGCY